MIVTDDDEIAKLCRSMRNQGRDEMGAWLEHVRLGYNYRMSEMSAALGVTQLPRLASFMAKRARVAAMYTERLVGLDWVRPPVVKDYVTMSWFVYVPITLAEGLQRDTVIARLAEQASRRAATLRRFIRSPTSARCSAISRDAAGDGDGRAAYTRVAVP